MKQDNFFKYFTLIINFTSISVIGNDHVQEINYKIDNLDKRIDAIASAVFMSSIAQVQKNDNENNSKSPFVIKQPEKYISK